MADDRKRYTTATGEVRGLVIVSLREKAGCVTKQCRGRRRITTEDVTNEKCVFLEIC